MSVQSNQESTKPKVPAIHELRKNGEWCDTRFFCSSACRERYLAREDERYKHELALDDDYIRGALCEWCDRRLLGCAAQEQANGNS